MKVSVFSVPSAVIGRTDQALRDAGQDRCEAFVLWSGVIRGNALEIRTAHIPRQTAYRSKDGVCVRVDGPELHRLNVWLYEHKEALAIQVHSHPKEAYHSETDSSYPIATVAGAVSIVVPDFGRGGVRGPGVAVYRLERGIWNELDDHALSALLRFGD